MSKDSRDGFQKGGPSNPNGISIIVGIVYVIAVKYNMLQVTGKNWFFHFENQKSNLALILRKPCHALLPKIHENGVAMRVGDTYTQGEYPTYTR